MTPEHALDGFLRALGISGEKIPAGVQARATLYRSLLYGRRVLVVLDNAHSTEQVSPLLPSSAGCVVGVTSRSRLSGLTGSVGSADHAGPVGPADPDKDQPLSLGHLAPAEAVALLAQVVGAARVDAEPGPAAEFARLCAHLPLALCIAAERVAVRTDNTLADLVK